MAEDWEIVPHQILAELRDEVHVLKEKLSQPSTKLDMVTAMNDLKKSILDMHAVFQAALEQTGKPENDLAQRLTVVEKQNERILQMLGKTGKSESMNAGSDMNERVAPMDSMLDMPEMSSMSAPPLPNVRRAPPPMRRAPPPMPPLPGMYPAMPGLPSSRSAPSPQMPGRVPPSLDSLGIPPPPPAPKKGLFGKLLQ